jgi:FAD dependent oxidoreductase
VSAGGGGGSGGDDHDCAVEGVETVVNCSGTNFGRDDKMRIVRGQTVLVRNPYHRTVTRQYADGRWATLIPRPGGGGTIVGVSKEVDDEEEGPRLETRQLLLEQSVECFPDFVQRLEDFDVVCDNVGRRPFREGGLRMEVEEVEEAEQVQYGCKRVVHGYGAGGRGYELSWAVAERLVELLCSAESGRT